MFYIQVTVSVLFVVLATAAGMEDIGYWGGWFTTTPETTGKQFMSTGSSSNGQDGGDILINTHALSGVDCLKLCIEYYRNLSQPEVNHGPKSGNGSVDLNGTSPNSATGASHINDTDAAANNSEPIQSCPGMNFNGTDFFSQGQCIIVSPFNETSLKPIDAKGWTFYKQWSPPPPKEPEVSATTNNTLSGNGTLPVNGTTNGTTV